MVKCLDVLEDLINGVKKASPYLSKTNSYLRRRRDCRATESFDKAIQILDQAMGEAIEFYKKKKPL
jgi:hypothetical protein